jgi:hypothetical protein
MSKSTLVAGPTTKRHERHRPEVTPERAICSCRLKGPDFALQISPHDKTFACDCNTKSDIRICDSPYIRRIICSKKKQKQHATREAIDGLSLATRVDRRVWHIHSRRPAYLIRGIAECAGLSITRCKQVMVFPQLHKPTASAKGSGI